MNIKMSPAVFVDKYLQNAKNPELARRLPRPLNKPPYPLQAYKRRCVEARANPTWPGWMASKRDTAFH